MPTVKRKTPAVGVARKKTVKFVAEPAAPNIGEVLKRIRLQRHLTVKDVADGCGISSSFLSMVERGDSDISLGRLGKLAAFFEHDIGSLLGYSTRLSKPRFIAKNERGAVDRGPGIEYEVVRIPGLEFELLIVKLGPHRAFKDSLSHEGFDLLVVTQGDVVLTVGNSDYPMHEGDCVYYSAAYEHSLANRSKRAAGVVVVTTGHMQ